MVIVLSQLVTASSASGEGSVSTSLVRQEGWQAQVFLNGESEWTRLQEAMAGARQYATSYALGFATKT